MFLHITGRHYDDMLCYDNEQAEVTSSESLPVNHVTSVALNSSLVTSPAVTPSRQLMTSSAAMMTSGDVQDEQAPATADVDDEIMTSSSQDGDDADVTSSQGGDDEVVTSSSQDDDDDDEDEAEAVTSPSAADMKQHVEGGPEVSVFSVNAAPLVRS